MDSSPLAAASRRSPTVERLTRSIPAGNTPIRKNNPAVSHKTEAVGLSRFPKYHQKLIAHHVPPYVLDSNLSQLLWRWVQAYSPELNKRCRSHLKLADKSYRVDETYIKVKGQDKYLYRAADSTGQTIDFLLAAKRDTAAAKRFFEKIFSSAANPIPRVINVDQNAAYPAAVDALKAEGTLPRRVRLRQCKYLNNVIEQDHRTVKKRTWLAKGYGSFQSAWRTLAGIETMNMIRKGRVRWIAKGNVVAEARFIGMLFAIAA